MGVEKNIIMKQYNGTDYDILLPNANDAKTVGGKSYQDIQSSFNGKVGWDLLYTGVIPSTEYNTQQSLILTSFPAYMANAMSQKYFLLKVVLTGSINWTTTSNVGIGVYCCKEPLISISTGTGNGQLTQFRADVICHRYSKTYTKDVSSTSASEDYKVISAHPQYTSGLPDWTTSGIMLSPVNPFDSNFASVYTYVDNTSALTAGVLWGGVVKLYGAWKEE